MTIEMNIVIIYFLIGGVCVDLILIGYVLWKFLKRIEKLEG